MWTVTLHTGENKWTVIEVDGPTHEHAIANARRLLGDYPVVEMS